MNYTSTALDNLRPNSNYVLRGNIIVWHDENNAQPTEAEINAEIVLIKAQEFRDTFDTNRTKIMDSIGWMHERKQSQDRLIFATLMTPEEAAWNATQGDEYYLYKQTLRDRPSIITDWTSISYPVVPQHVYDAMSNDIKALCQELQCDPVV